MLLSDRDILERIGRGEVMFDPPLVTETQIQAASVDLRLGNLFRRFNHRDGIADPLDPRTFDRLTTLVEIGAGDTIPVSPGELILGTTLEKVTLPDDLAGHLYGRSSLIRMGISVPFTAGFIDPGFSGHITLEISNLGKVPVLLHPYMRICQLTFVRLTSPVITPYGEHAASKYQDQQGPTPSLLHEDFEFLR
jgi:dCTP deaminase